MSVQTVDFSGVSPQDPLSQGGVWAPIGGGGAQCKVVFAVSANRATGHPVANLSFSRYVGSPAYTWNADQYSEATFLATPVADNNYIGVGCRMSASAMTCYMLQLSWISAAAKLNLWKIVAGSFAAIATQVAITISAGDILRLTVTGTSIVGTQNGVTKISATNGDITAADPPGLVSYYTNADQYMNTWAGSPYTLPAVFDVAMFPYNPSEIYLPAGYSTREVVAY